MNDWELIQDYAASGSEDAFRHLVQRHLNLVYFTALRRVGGDTHLAQDIAQVVFTNLARKAATLGPNVVLPGWLHRDTCFTSMEVLRSKQRRAAREEQAVVMSEMEHNAPPPEWQQIYPLLDDALEQLKPGDRDALLLRFFEEHTLIEIGKRLGSTESGASRRISRVLEKLRRLLLKRGVTTSTAVLTALLSAQAANAAPTGLAMLLATASAGGTLPAAVSTTSALSPGILMASLKVKSGIAMLIGAGLLISAVIIHRRDIPRLFADNQNTDEPHLRTAAELMTSLMNAAINNGDQFPATLESFGPAAAENYELVFKGNLKTLEKPNVTIVIREKVPWRSANRKWARAYGFADGHSLIQQTADGKFEPWERGLKSLNSNSQ